MKRQTHISFHKNNIINLNEKEKIFTSIQNDGSNSNFNTNNFNKISDSSLGNNSFVNQTRQRIGQTKKIGSNIIFNGEVTKLDLKNTKNKQFSFSNPESLTERFKTHSLVEKSVDKNQSRIEYISLIQKKSRQDTTGKGEQFGSDLVNSQSFNEKQKQKQYLKSKLEIMNEQLKRRQTIIMGLESQINEKNFSLSTLHSDLLILKKQIQNRPDQSQIKRLQEFQKSARIQIDHLCQDNYNFAEEIKKILQAKNIDIQNLQQKVAFLEEERSKLSNLVFEKERQVIQLLEKQRFMQQGQETNISETQRTNEFERLGTQFEIKINFLVEENCKLKNNTNNLEGKVESLVRKNECLQKIIKAFEERQSNIEYPKQVEQIQYLRQKLEQEKQQKDRIASKYDLQILKLENLIDQQIYLTHGKISWSPCQDQRLQQSLAEAIEQIANLRQRLRQKKI